MLKIVFSIFALTAFFFTSNISAQTKVANPKIVVAAPKSPKPPKQGRRVLNEEEIPAEKFIATDAKVNISLCVSEGKIKINGWGRDEIRAFVKDGSSVGFSVREKNPQTSKPNLVRVLGYDPEKNKEPGNDECLSGENIELDVPRGAYVDLKGQQAEIAIKSVGKVRINIDAGDISLNEISRGIEARTYEGDVMVERSSGTMTLNSTSGSIVVLETENNDVGDSLTAKTISGSITMQQAAQKQIEAVSNTGSIVFNGKFESGGQYSFTTTNGAINLEIPADSSCRIEAFYGGKFQSDLPLKSLTTDNNSSVKVVVGVVGAGDANLSLKNFSGSINIRKK